MNILRIISKRNQRLGSRFLANGNQKFQFSTNNEDPYSKMCREQKEKVKQRDQENRKNRNLNDYLLMSSLGLFILTTTYFVGKKGLSVMEEFQNPYANKDQQKK